MIATAAHPLFHDLTGANQKGRRKSPYTGENCDLSPEQWKAWVDAGPFAWHR